MTRARCDLCGIDACTADIKKTPEFCPRRMERNDLKKAKEIVRNEPVTGKITRVANEIESEGYKVWQRIKELVEFSKRMGYRKLGVAFCSGLREETRSLCKILKKNGFEVYSVCCTIEGGCNPVGQAMVLNQIETDLNVIMGLCIGHDVLFTKYSRSPLTTLVVKDRVTCHNPAAPLLNRYWKDTF